MQKYELHPEFHNYLAVELNSKTWELLEKEDRTAQDNSTMLVFAFGSLFHWSHSPSCQPVNLQRAQWLISHVYAVLKNGKKALKHAENCFEITKEHNIKDFDLAYSYEALYRAYKILGDTEKENYFFNKAKEAAENIRDKEDKEIFLSDLNS